MDRVILHCDCNSFFASVEAALDPKLNEYAFAVCGDPERRHGIVLAKNEKAKRFGVATGEPIWKAKAKCPKLVTVMPTSFFITRRNSSAIVLPSPKRCVVPETSSQHSSIPNGSTRSVYLQ